MDLEPLPGRGDAAHTARATHPRGDREETCRGGSSAGRIGSQGLGQQSCAPSSAVGTGRLRGRIHPPAVLRAVHVVRGRRVRRDAGLGPDRLPLPQADGPGSAASVRAGRGTPVHHGGPGQAGRTLPAPARQELIPTPSRVTPLSTDDLLPDTLRTFSVRVGAARGAALHPTGAVFYNIGSFPSGDARSVGRGRPRPRAKHESKERRWRASPRIKRLGSPGARLDSSATGTRSVWCAPPSSRPEV